ncbi:fatty acid cis/trans isomerase [Bdellovibrio bacteriovorus]|uniref:fatty acid cis/trans isomerase n=1 Tax=Bdellovibrio bacteriovorus TaxID=959 RepID=UPI0035A65555
MQFIKIMVVCFISVVMTSVSKAEVPVDLYTRRIQPIFDNRCVACHSCFNGPCQLNLQNFEGFERGANKLNVYNGTRTSSVAPSRLWIDAHGTSEWRKRDFYELNTSRNSKENLFMGLLQLRFEQPKKNIQRQVAESQICPSSPAELETIRKNSPELGMPYGLPALSAAEMNHIEEWIKKGAPGPTAQTLKEQSEVSPVLRKQIREWEAFLNDRDIPHQLVSRYIYEHLFLAHIYFPEEKNQFFRLVRSKTACAKGAEEIATRRPNDDPSVASFHYCLKKFPGTVVLKTHIPYEWSPAKLARYKKIFWATKWSAETIPSYEPTVAENPFKAFKDIPVKARYQFLLDDAQYEVSTFIKGPVCNGSMAVNSIQEQFYVFFLNPDSDNMVLSRDYEVKAQDMLMLPGVWGSDVKLQDTPIFLKRLVDHREAYRVLRNEWYVQNKPQGYSLKDIWDGEGVNNNAVLTVFRHDDNAVVLKGAIGDLSKTVFVLDYPLLERLVYNLVVNFDVFGNVSHQLLTRIYMDMIRMEAEELFLMFLPSEQRLQYRREWYRGLLARAKMAYIFPTVGAADPTAIKYNEEIHTKKQLVEKILFFRLNETVRGSFDRVNWKSLQVPDSMAATFKPHGLEKELRPIAAVKAGKATPFAKYFPDLSLLKVTSAEQPMRVFSIIHNKEHENISWITGESLRMDPKNDTLTVHEGYWGSYPNMIFDVEEKNLAIFVAQIQKVKSAKDYQKLVDVFGVRRTQDSFWLHYDELIAHFRNTDPTQFGFLDLTRYELK